MRAKFALLVAVFFCSSCATKNAPQWVTLNTPSTLPAEQVKTVSTETSVARMVTEPELAPGYVIQLSDPQDGALNGKFQIKNDGLLELPYSVKIYTTGMDLAGLQKQVEQSYSPYFKGTPATKVKVADKKLFVEVGGLVEKPGKFQIKADASLDELITQAGGLQKAGDQSSMAKYVRIKQGDQIRLVRLSDYYAGNTNLTLRWAGGDQLFFQKEGGGLLAQPGETLGNVQILGQVKSPGEYGFNSQADFFYYLTQAGGLTDRADMDDLMLVRLDQGQRKVMNFSMSQIQDLPQVQAGDLILVNADNPSKADKDTRILSQIGQFFGAVATGVLLVVAL